MLATESQQLQAEVIKLRQQVEELTQTNTRLENLLHHYTSSSCQISNQVPEDFHHCEKLLEAIPIAILIVKVNGSLCYTNSLALQLLGNHLHNPPPLHTQTPMATEMGTEEWLRWSPLYLAGTTQKYPVDNHPLILALKGQVAHADNLEWRYADQITLLEMWAAPLLTEQPGQQYAIALFQDITFKQHIETTRINTIREEIHSTLSEMEIQLQREAQERQRVEEALQRANQDLEELVVMDPLTQLPNHRRLNDYLRQEWRRLTRDKLPLSLVICTIDYFEDYTNQYGITVAENHLKDIAQAISRAAKRPSDLVARYHTEGFAAVLPNTNADGAVQVAAGMRWEVKMLKLPHEHSPVSRHVTLSVGVSSIIPTAMTSPEGLIKAAAEALLEAQQKGRNRVEYKEYSSN